MYTYISREDPETWDTRWEVFDGSDLRASGRAQRRSAPRTWCHEGWRLQKELRST